MIKTFLLSVVALLLTAIVVIPAQHRVDDPEVAKLRKEAHKRGLRWRIECDPGRPSEWRFFAIAELRSVPEGTVYIEDGAKPLWYALGETQVEAVRALYTAIQQEPNFQPEHRPKHKEKLCPVPLHGD